MYEYKRISDTALDTEDIMKWLNELTNEGWELISVVPRYKMECYYYILKRKKNEKM